MNKHLIQEGVEIQSIRFREKEADRSNGPMSHGAHTCMCSLNYIWLWTPFFLV